MPHYKQTRSCRLYILSNDVCLKLKLQFYAGLLYILFVQFRITSHWNCCSKTCATWPSPWSSLVCHFVFVHFMLLVIAFPNTFKSPNLVNIYPWLGFWNLMGYSMFVSLIKVPKGNPYHSATSGEMSIYRANSLILRKVGCSWSCQSWNYIVCFT